MIVKAGILVLTLGFALPAFADNQRPNPVEGLEADMRSDSSIELSWDKPWDNTGVKGYNVYKDRRYVATVSERRFTDSDVKSGRSYDYYVTAFDYNRNHSSKSDILEVSIGEVASASNNRAAADEFGPPQSLSATEVSQGRVRWEWSDVAGADHYEVTVDGIFSGKTADTEFFSDDLWRGNHSLTVKTVDGNGNISVQSDTHKIYVRDDSSVGSIVLADASDDADEEEQREEEEREEQQREEEVQVAQSAPVDNASDTGLVDPASYNQPNIGREGYDLVFSDEFNGASVNAARWGTNLRWDGDWNGERYEYRVINRESQFYVSPNSPDQEMLSDVVPAYNPFKFDGNSLAIRAIVNPLKERDGTLSYGPLDDIVEQQDFLSGALSTHNTFYRKYGYFEARIKIPNHVGTFPAFWLYAKKRRSQGSQRTEIDIMENLGHAPWYVYTSMHYFKNATVSYGGDHQFIKPEPNGQIYTGTDYSDDYYVYAIKWEPGHVEWLINGEKVSEVYHEAADNEELYITLNLAMGGAWTNFPTNAGGLGRDEDEFFPNSSDIRNFGNPELKIDYIRVYAPE